MTYDIDQLAACDPQKLASMLADLPENKRIVGWQPTGPLIATRLNSAEHNEGDLLYDGDAVLLFVRPGTIAKLWNISDRDGKPSDNGEINNVAMSVLTVMYKEARQPTFDRRDPLSDDMDGPPKQVRDWRNYVSQFRGIWHALHPEARIIAALIAKDAADREEWD